MSSNGYKRATKKFPTRVDHLDGSVTTGGVLVPVGGDFVTTISQGSAFLNFETDEGEETYIAIASIKRITQLQEKVANEKTDEEEDRARREQREEAERRRKSGEQARASSKDRTASASAEKKASPYTTSEQYDALDVLGLGEFATRDEIQAAYRRLVKLYHPDRLRGLGVAESKISYAAEKLSEINNAYRLLMRVAEAA